MIAIVLGMLVRNTVGIPAACAPGIRFSLRRILRFAIVLLGFQLSARQIAEVGGMGLFVVAVTLVAAFFFTTWLGKRLGVDRKLSELIAAGTSICGASAIVATNAVTEGSDPTTVVSSRCPRVFTRRTQKPLSSLWKVTRSITPEISSVAGLRSGTAAFIGDSFSHGRSALGDPLDSAFCWDLAAPMGFGSAPAFQRCRQPL